MKYQSYLSTQISISKVNKIGRHRKLLRETQYQNQCTSNHISGLKDWVSMMYILFKLIYSSTQS